VRRRVDWTLVALLLLAALARFSGLGARSLWFDEALSGLIARLDTVQVLANAAGSSHPPGYYFLLHLWQPLGKSEFALRFPSAWCSLAAVALVARLGRDVFDRRTARLAALGMALSPFQVYYGQEARMYAIAVLVSAGVLWSFLRGVQGDGRAAWWAYGVLTALGLYVHYYVALVVLALHLWLLLDWRRARRVLVPLLVADGLVGLAFLPQAAQFLFETGEYVGGVTSWQPRPSLLSPLTTLYYLVFGLVRPMGAAWLDWAWVGLGLFLVLALLALAAVSLVRRGRGHIGWALLSLIAAPVLVILAISSVTHSIYSERSFAVVTPGLMLLLAWEVSKASRRSPALYLGTILIVLAVVGVILYHGQPDPAKPPLREAVAAVTREAQAGDVILHLQDASYIPACYYASDMAGALVDAGQELWLAAEVYALFGGQTVQPEQSNLAGRTWLTVMPGYLARPQWAFLEERQAAHSPVLFWDRAAVQVYTWGER